MGDGLSKVSLSKVWSGNPCTHSHVPMHASMLSQHATTFACCTRSTTGGKCARKNGFVSISKPSDTGTVGNPLCRSSRTSAMRVFSVVLLCSIVFANAALDSVYLSHPYVHGCRNFHDLPLHCHLFICLLRIYYEAQHTNCE